MRYPTRPGVPSENGWPMIDGSGTTRVTIPGAEAARVIPLRKGDAGVILAAFARDYHVHVEPIISQIWGWSPDNDVADSNHMSGTAIDINAVKYPWGTYRMPAELVAKVEALLKRYRGVVYWGRRWSKPDEMHFQIGVLPVDARLAEIVADIRAGRLGNGVPVPPAPGPAPAPGGRRLLRRGDTGDDVRQLQAHLNKVFPRYSTLAVDGQFGPATEAVVREAQRRGGIDIDGVVGPVTRRVILWT